MRNIAPTGSIYQAGTLSGNPLAMTAGLLTLRRLKDKTIYERLEQRSANLCEGLSQAATNAGIKTITNRVGSMWTSFFTDEPVTNWATANKSNRELYGRFFHDIKDLERSGFDTVHLRVQLEKKFSVPYSLWIMAMIPAPFCLLGWQSC